MVVEDSGIHPLVAQGRLDSSPHNHPHNAQLYMRALANLQS